MKNANPNKARPGNQNARKAPSQRVSGDGKPTSIALGALLPRVQEEARAHGVSVSAYVREAVTEKLQREGGG